MSPLMGNGCGFSPLLFFVTLERQFDVNSSRSPRRNPIHPSVKRNSKDNIFPSIDQFPRFAANFSATHDTSQITDQEKSASRPNLKQPSPPPIVIHRRRQTSYRATLLILNCTTQSVLCATQSVLCGSSAVPARFQVQDPRVPPPQSHNAIIAEWE